MEKKIMASELFQLDAKRSILSLVLTILIYSLPYGDVSDISLFLLEKGTWCLDDYLMKSLIPSLTVAATLVRPDQVVSVVLLSVKYGPNTKRNALSHILYSTGL